MGTLMAPGTTLRNIRIGDELWQAAQAKAARDGVTLSDVIRDHLAAWVEGEVNGQA